MGIEIEKEIGYFSILIWTLKIDNYKYSSYLIDK